MAQPISQSQDTPPPLNPYHTLWPQLELWHYQRSKAAIYTNIHTYCTCALPSMASGPFQECQRWFHPLYLPFFRRMMVTHTDWDGCGPESHLEWLNYNKALWSQRIEHQIKENGGKAWLWRCDFHVCYTLKRKKWAPHVKLESLGFNLISVQT